MTSEERTRGESASSTRPGASPSTSPKEESAGRETEERAETPTQNGASDPTPRPRRARRMRKRTRFAMPARAAQSVKALWQEASQKDRERAHRTGMLILETWLGKKTRPEAARELEVPVLRFWQLSQQAVSGMLAGLLIQPRTRRSPEMPKLSPEEDPRVLTRRIEKLERELRTANDLIEVLKLIPDRPPAPPEPEAKSARPKKKAGTRPARRAKPAGGKRQSARGRRGAAAGGADSSGAEA